MRKTGLISSLAPMKHVTKFKKMFHKTSEVFRCELCDLSLNSEQQLLQHQNGRTHIRKMKDLGMASQNDNLPDENPTTTIIRSTGPSKYGIQFVRASSDGGEEKAGDSDDSEKNSSKGCSGSSSSVDPVTQAVVDNALGKINLKRKATEVTCPSCQITFNSQMQAEQHFSGSKHAKKLRAMGQKPTPMPPLQNNTNGQFEVKKHGLFFCSICSVGVNSLQQMDAHRTGSKHRSKVQKLKLRGKTVDDSADEVTYAPPVTAETKEKSKNAP